MELPVLLAVAAFLACGMYLILDRTLLRVILGLGLFSNGINLMLLTTGGLTEGAAPVLLDGVSPNATVDPLPQALILTAIVISFGVTALMLVIAYRTFQTVGGDDLTELHGRMHDE
jgi:multicomponent Na+:H+ antiporter subunit C